MGLSRLFSCSAPEFKYADLSHAGYTAASSEYDDEERVFNDIRRIINHYNIHINPPVQPGERKAAHYAKRLNPCSTQKFLCGEKGRTRVDRFSQLLDVEGFSSPKILRDVCEYAYTEYKKGYTNSWTASRILWCIGYHLGMERERITKQYANTAESGGDTGEYTEIEGLKSYLEGAYTRLMRKTYAYRNEERDEKAIKQSRKETKG